LSYIDNYERGTFGIIGFWVCKNFELGDFFDREISHYEMELAHANHHIIKAKALEAFKLELSALVNS